MPARYRRNPSTPRRELAKAVGHLLSHSAEQVTVAGVPITVTDVRAVMAHFTLRQRRAINDHLVHGLPWKIIVRRSPYCRATLQNDIAAALDATWEAIVPAVPYERSREN